MKKEKREKHTWYLVRYMQAPNKLYKSEVRASVLRVETACEQGLPHCTYVLQAEQRLPSATEETAKRTFPMARTCYKQSNAFLLRRRRRQSAVSPWNVDPLRSTTLRGIRSARTSPTLPDAAYDSRNQGRVVLHSELSRLSACVRLCQLQEVHHSLQQSLNPLRVRK